MKILAVDTSGMIAAVAVMDDEEVLAEYNLNNGKTHSQRLMPMVCEVMDSVGLKPEDIDFYAAASGPGSFTGLRIGITTLKAIAYASGKPVISVPTLDALAYNIPRTELLVCPMMDARNRQVYTALYGWTGGKLSKVTEYMGVTVEELTGIVKGKNQKTVFLGDGVKLHKDYLLKELGDMCEFSPPALMLQRGCSVAVAGLVMAAEGRIENCFDMVPFYLRKSQAEREFDKKTLFQGGAR